MKNKHYIINHKYGDFLPFKTLLFLIIKELLIKKLYRLITKFKELFFNYDHEFAVPQKAINTSKNTLCGVYTRIIVLICLKKFVRN